MSRGGGESGAVFKSHKAAKFDSVGTFPANFCGDKTYGTFNPHHDILLTLSMQF